MPPPFAFCPPPLLGYNSNATEIDLRSAPRLGCSRQIKNTRATPTPRHTMSSSMATYLVLVTAGLSVTYLGYMMYAAFGLAAVKAVAPFIGSISVVFGEEPLEVVRCTASSHDASCCAKCGLLGGEILWLGSGPTIYCSLSLRDRLNAKGANTWYQCCTAV